jgi:hypothetical protein
MASAQTDTKKKSRLSNLFKKDKNNDHDYTQEPTNPHSNAPPRQQDHDMLDPDSAYGGSDIGNSTSSSRENVPTMTKSAAVAQNMPTRQQFDTNSGRVITTTTTTTTTTVTTMGGDQITIPAGREVVVTKDETSQPQEMSARPLSKEIHEEELRDQGQQYQGGSSGVGSGMPGNHSPPIPAKDGRRRSKSPSTLAVGQGHHTRRLSADRDDGPVSPNGHQNFSYPARTTPPQAAYAAVSPQRTGPQRGRFSYEDVPVPPVPGSVQGRREHSIPRVPANQSLGAQDPNQGSYQPYRQESAIGQNSSRPRPPIDPSHGQPGLNGQPAREHVPYSNGENRPQSTIQSLKFAAAGIHGAGETLRGALNSNIDRRTGASEAQMAKHNAVLERGRQEIETGHFQRASNNSLNSSAVSEPEELMQTQTQEKKSRGLRNVLRKKSRDRDGLGAVRE